MFPTKLDQITDTWLTATLQDRLGLESQVIDHRVAPVAEPGQTAQVVRIELTYDRNEAGAPASLIAKLPAEDEALLGLMREFDMYAREIAFYREVGVDAGIPVPRCFFADYRADTGEFLLILEDRSDSVLGNWLSPSPEQVETAVSYLPAFHAKWWNSKSLYSFDWAFHLDSSVWIARVTESLQRAVPVVLSNFSDHISDYLAATATALAEKPSVLRRLGKEPRTLVHGDYFLNQILFRDRGVCVIDWQLCGVGNSTCDLARVVWSGLKVEARRDLENSLLRQYHEGLVARGVRDYNLSQVAEDYRLGLLYSLWIEVVAWAETDVSILEKQGAARGVSAVEVSFSRLSASLEDHKVLDLFR